MDVLKFDSVKTPLHYTSGAYETIDILQGNLTDEQFEGFCVGNVLKYTLRYRHKNGIEDLRKARQYLNRVINAMEGKREW